MLNEDGILLGLDMTDVRNKITGKGLLGFFNNFNWSTTLILLFNIGTVVIYYHYSNMRLNQMGNIARRRQTEINNVIQEIIRLNNLNLAYSTNLINRNQGDENQNINLNDNIINNINNVNNNNSQNENDNNTDNVNIQQNNNLNDNENPNQNEENQNNNEIAEDNHIENNLIDNIIREDNNYYENEINEHHNLFENSNENYNIENNININENHGEELFMGTNHLNNRNFHFDLNRNLNSILSQLNRHISDVRVNNNNNPEAQINNMNQTNNENALDSENFLDNQNIHQNSHMENNIQNNTRDGYHIINLGNNTIGDSNSKIEIANENDFEINRVNSKDNKQIDDENKETENNFNEEETPKRVHNTELNKNNSSDEPINNDIDNSDKKDIR